MDPSFLLHLIFKIFRKSLPSVIICSVCRCHRPKRLFQMSSVTFLCSLSPMVPYILLISISFLSISSSKSMVLSPIMFMASLETTISSLIFCAFSADTSGFRSCNCLTNSFFGVCVFFGYLNELVQLPYQ